MSTGDIMRVAIPAVIVFGVCVSLLWLALPDARQTTYQGCLELSGNPELCLADDLLRSTPAGAERRAMR